MEAAALILSDINDAGQAPFSCIKLASNITYIHKLFSIWQILVFYFAKKVVFVAIVENRNNL